MLEVFAGSAVLCSVAKQQGLYGSIAVDKVQKRGSRASIIRLDLTRDVDCHLLESWLSSDLLLWVHLAPVCGTASRAREIRIHPSDPKPLHSSDYPDGLPNLDGRDELRVQIANRLFQVACMIFDKASQRGIFVAMENPKNSHFWGTSFFEALWKRWELWCSDFQVCMYGGERDKWTRLVANFRQIQQLDIVCNKAHKHAPWRFTRDAEGKQVWATSVESQYPRKLCVALTQCVLQHAERHGLQLLPNSLQELDTHPLLAVQKSQIAVGHQPDRKKLPPMVPDFAATAVACIKDLQDIPVPVLTRLSHDLVLMSMELQPITLPKGSRFLRFFNPSDSTQGGVVGEPDGSMSKSVTGADLSSFPLRAVFELPWAPEEFVQKAARMGHPALSDLSVPEDLDIATQRNLSWSVEQMVKYRKDWCKQWLVRAKELEAAEKEDRSRRPVHVQQNTQNKRLLLTREILESIQYPDVEALEILRNGATLAGDIRHVPVFEEQFKPCLITRSQLENGASKTNAVDELLLEETRQEVSKNWVRGPYKLEDLPEGSVVSRRFALVQANKTRMIDDFSISGVNDSCNIHSKISLHMVDTLGAVVRKYFSISMRNGVDSCLEAKTFDLKSAYRQIAIHEEHLRYAYFSVYNHEIGGPEVYQLVTLPFGAVHSVYNVLTQSILG